MRRLAFSGILTTLTLAAAGMPAQVQGEVVAHTDLLLDGAVVAPAGTVLVAAGSRIGRSYGVSGGGLVCPNGASVGALYWLQRPGVPLQFHSRASWTGAVLCPPATRTSGSHAALFRFHAAQPTQGSLVISTSVPVPGLSSYAIDVGNDGTIELESAGGSTAGSSIVPLTVRPGAPFEVRVVSSARASQSGSASMDVDVQFLEGVMMPTFGSGCRIWSGDVFSLSGRYVERAVGGTLRLYATNSPITTVDPFMIFGTRQLALPIPPTGCLLWTEILLAVPVPTGLSGTVSLDVPVPPGLSGARFFVQCIRGAQPPVGPPSWWTTNGVDVTLP